jgi:MerR family transcriptional regulator, copper efflux regulator
VEARLLRSGELARRAGVSTDLLRHYERMGIVPRPERASNGYRQYPARALGRVRVVRRSLSLGFSLAELARIFAIRDRGGAPCREVRNLAKEKLRQVEQGLLELKTLRRQLRETVVDWDRRLRKTPKGRTAGLLDSLKEDGVSAGSTRDRWKKGLARK